MTESSVSVVIPVFNAEAYIEELYRELKTVLSEHFNRFEIIFVDDASSDRSGDAVHAIAEADPSCTAVSLSENVGQQKATFCGLQYTSGEYVVTIDDDGQYAPDDIIRLHAAILEGKYDCVYGIPLIRSRRLIRRLGTWLTDRSLSRLTGKEPAVKVSSFRIMSRELASQVLACPSCAIYLSVEILKLTKRIGNLPIELRHEERATRYTLRRLLKAFTAVHTHGVGAADAGERFMIGKLTGRGSR